jgi:hypothetical protein
MIRRTFRTARTFSFGIVLAAVVGMAVAALTAQGTISGLPSSIGMPVDFGWGLSIGTQNTAGTSQPFAAAPVTGSVGGGVNIKPDLRQGIGSESLEGLRVAPTVTTLATGTDALVTSLHVAVPVITSGGATITTAANVKVDAAPTAGGTNLSLWVVGNSQFDAGLSTTAGTLSGWTVPTAGLKFSNATSGTITLAATSGALGSVTLSLPAATDTLVGKATTDILSNKTIPTAGLAFTNATSGSITLATPTGALATPTVTLPAATGSVPAIYSCGASLAAAGACANTTAGAATFHIITGSFLLSGSTSTVTGISPAFTSATSWWCVANDVTTRANPVQAIPASGSTVTITNTTGATDLIQMICMGS